MAEFFVNLKRFEVPRELGGLCPMDDPIVWIEDVISTTISMGLGRLPDHHLTYLLPEGLISSAIQRLITFPTNETETIAIGCQGVHWENIVPGGNFGAFTSNLPATAAKNLGCSWAIIGHSEERKAKHQVVQAFEPSIGQDDHLRSRASMAIDKLINHEVRCALQAGLNVLLCVGETEEERGGGQFDGQKPRIESVLKSQLLTDLEDVREHMNDRHVVIGYEPIWAIGPGKTPPDKEYIGFVSSFIKHVLLEKFDFDPVVVYGGGLKEENAGMLSSIETIGGGLVALTRFTGDIGFDVEGLKRIIDEYLSE